jgi:biotin synthase
MCLTIPAKVVEIKGREAVIQKESSNKTIDISLIPDVKVGDWILFANRTAVQIISAVDAKEIVDLLESYHPNAQPDQLTEKFKNIIENSKKRDLTKEEIIYLLQVEGAEKEALYSEADVVRRANLQDFICIHGIIEFSNYCKNDCVYCGLRCQNTEIKRYRMTPEEIVATAVKAANVKGYKLLVLQSGEDPYYTAEMFTDIIRKIKSACKVFVFISVGERGLDFYKKLKEVGASGTLFRFETSNQELFKKIHANGKNLENRLEHLKFMKELEYFIATGSIIGLPGQTIEDLADDIMLMRKWANMVSMGPFVPSKNTPLEKENPGDPEMNFKMISVLRILMPKIRIPVVTALETLAGEGGRKKGLLAGANSLMLNLTPGKYRANYKIYDNKFFDKESIWEKYGLFKAEESYQMIEERMGEELNKVIKFTL